MDPEWKTNLLNVMLHNTCKDQVYFFSQALSLWTWKNVMPAHYYLAILNTNTWLKRSVLNLIAILGLNGFSSHSLLCINESCMTGTSLGLCYHCGDFTGYCPMYLSVSRKNHVPVLPLKDQESHIEPHIFLAVLNTSHGDFVLSTLISFTQFLQCSLRISWYKLDPIRILFFPEYD